MGRERAGKEGKGREEREKGEGREQKGGEGLAYSCRLGRWASQNLGPALKAFRQSPITICMYQVGYCDRYP